MFDATAYNQFMNEYERQLDSSYKKTQGIFYTDLFLANKIIEMLNIEKNCIVMDPCCGTGSFLIAAKENGINNVYGSDIDEKAIDNITNQFNNKVKSIDTIGKDGTYILKEFGIDRFDYIVGNPPYVPLSDKVEIKSDNYLFLRKVTDSGNNLFIAALIRAFELVKKDGIISYIIPKNFLHVSSYSLLRREILKEKTIISITDIGAYFKKVRGEQIILTIKNSLPDIETKIQINSLKNKEIIKMTSIDQSFYNDEILLFNSDYEFDIYKKLSSSYQKLKDVCKGYVGRGKSSNITAVTGKDIRKFGYKNIRTPKSGNRLLIQNIYSSEAGIIAAMGGELEATETVTILTDTDEKMCTYLLGILHSRLCNFYLYKFCYNNSKLTMHTDSKYLKKIPLCVKNSESFNNIIDIVNKLEEEEYLTDTWYDNFEHLNRLVYDAYDISDLESQFIDNEMKQIQSKKWVKQQ